MTDTQKRDIERNPSTQHETASRSARERGDLTRRTSGDLGRDPFAMMHAFRREMDRLFGDFAFGGSLFRSASEMWSPQVEVFERDGKLHVSADLPGLNKDDVRIEVVDDNLTIEGERRSEQRDERGRWSERSYGSFFRSIPLPQGVNPDTAKASFENGVLNITFEAPRREERRGRQIKIER